MNLRILKKLSKRAAPLLLQLEKCPYMGTLDHYPASRGEGCVQSSGFDRKHWDRCESAHRDLFRQTDILTEPSRRAGLRYPYVKLSEPDTCWDGTPLVGWSSGYETPEWDERTAWEYLEDLVFGDGMDVVLNPAGNGADVPDHDYIQTLRLPNPAAVLRHARVMVARMVSA
ncbi:hypothetical protein LJR143_001703 [Pseudoxanthomonas sp. LjRoot143]|uniref:hypothetical protein n=1 Tax=Pseudoxanthomonas sp. LjRoot143 TaxID=3342266 RepID=UPI003ED01DAC